MKARNLNHDKKIKNAILYRIREVSKKPAKLATAKNCIIRSQYLTFGEEYELSSLVYKTQKKKLKFFWLQVNLLNFRY